MHPTRSPLEQFTLLSKKYPSPQKVQGFLRSMKYNFEEEGETVRSAIEAYRLKTAHCLEASFLAAAILEHQGYPPLLLSLDSIDHLNHVLFIFKEKTGWGAISRSRDEGLHGRAPRFKTIRDLAWSYYEPYVDRTAEVVGYETVDLNQFKTDWRASTRNLRQIEHHIITLKFKKIRAPRSRHRLALERYLKKGPMKVGKYWW